VVIELLDDGSESDDSPVAEAQGESDIQGEVGDPQPSLPPTRVSGDADREGEVDDDALMELLVSLGLRDDGLARGGRGVSPRLAEDGDADRDVLTIDSESSDQDIDVFSLFPPPAPGSAPDDAPEQPPVGVSAVAAGGGAEAEAERGAVISGDDTGTSVGLDEEKSTRREADQAALHGAMPLSSVDTETSGSAAAAPTSMSREKLPPDSPESENGSEGDGGGDFGHSGDGSLGSAGDGSAVDTDSSIASCSVRVLSLWRVVCEARGRRRRSA
jgi:hypothetical protein